MAYNITEEKLLEMLVSDPSWCLFYHRERVRQLLPAMAQSYVLVGGLQKELTKNMQENKEKEEKLLEDRNPECVENWPECENGKYHPLCCRFPKSCSC